MVFINLITSGGRKGGRDVAGKVSPLVSNRTLIIKIGYSLLKPGGSTST